MESGETIFCRGVNKRVRTDSTIPIDGRPTYEGIFCDTGEPVRELELQPLFRLISDTHNAHLITVHVPPILRHVSDEAARRALRELDSSQRAEIVGAAEAWDESDKEMLRAYLRADASAMG